MIVTSNGEKLFTPKDIAQSVSDCRIAVNNELIDVDAVCVPLLGVT